MERLRSFLFFASPFACWGVLATYFFIQGNVWAAFCASFPFVAFVLFLAFPRSGPGYFAFRYDIGPVEKEGESARHYYLRMAKWWFLGSLSFPLSMVLALWTKGHDGMLIAIMFAGVMFGIPCFLKCLGALCLAARSKADKADTP